ncbi:hypothetical protein F4804DRAFT_269803 [Jackrogersella minutella]|nr:hypothetical protein F4804DRAFT_269803 [Jackrogersella minutella]
MAVGNNCAHSFKMLKSDSTLIQWTCHMCHSGPHWWIFELPKITKISALSRPSFTSFQLEGSSSSGVTGQDLHTKKKSVNFFFFFTTPPTQKKVSRNTQCTSIFGSWRARGPLSRTLRSCRSWPQQPKYDPIGLDRCPLSAVLTNPLPCFFSHSLSHSASRSNLSRSR